ncbi:MAG: hypothetical protein PHR35_16440 [Kiritimatiellae bacterium]|nr:hypothetical protein [Kiritimatiellia bacterium]
MTALQKMLLQSDDEGRLYLFPAWPAHLDADFRLRAPGGRTVEAAMADGKIVKLIVTPPMDKTKLILPAGVSGSL